MPTGHDSHDASSFTYVPGSQSPHEERSSELSLPFAQRVQLDWPSAILYRPDSQRVQGGGEGERGWTSVGTCTPTPLSPVGGERRARGVIRVATDATRGARSRRNVKVEPGQAGWGGGGQGGAAVRDGGGGRPEVVTNGGQEVPVAGGRPTRSSRVHPASHPPPAQLTRQPWA